MLLDILERYHIKDICNYITRTKDYDPESEDWLFEGFKEKTFKEKLMNFWNRFWRHTNPYSRYNKNSYASFVLHNIINDPAFVSLASNIRPYFFADIFITFKLKKRNSFPTELVNQYLTELLKHKNFWLIKELKQSDNFDIGQPDWFFKENRVIAALIQDVSVADVNEIWKPFGEEAIKEIESERNLGTDSRLYQQYRNDDMLWEFKVFISIKFFNILLIESIVKKYSGTHFFLSYYWHITESILQNFTASPPKDFEEVESANHHLVKIMNDNLFHWLDLSNKYETDRFYDIIRCIGNQLDCISKNLFFGEARKIDLIERVLSIYCNIDEKGKTNIIRDELDSILLKPSMLTRSTDPYYKYFNKVWERFDKIPHRGYVHNTDFEYFSRLKEKVIIPLGLNPDVN
ncbi:hypothetical protein GCM10011339_40950 [Echinicola rosea]|uniref:Uncharacterized protein n=2 Tax=Echinicola rosea TaxID=1807691 RepID=A0ABQ1VCB8_9BACT|nr:hypothetical protein GCM10011339_40950 [Echinicola rosea]